MKLSNAAIVRSGLVLSRKQARGLSEIRYPLLNLRSINANGYIDLEQTDMFDSTEHLSPEYLSQVGDIIIRLTAPYTAVLIDNKTSGMVVSSNFVIVRPDKKFFFPEYLYWLFNTTKIKRDIFEKSSSNMLSAVNAKYFSDLDIMDISISKQNTIAKINELSIRESKLLKQLAEAKALYHTITLNQLYNEIRRGN